MLCLVYFKIRCSTPKHVKSVANAHLYLVFYDKGFFLLGNSAILNRWLLRLKSQFEITKLNLYQSISELERRFIPPNCTCKSTAVICVYLNLTLIPKTTPQVTSLFLYGNRLQLTVNSFDDVNLTQNLYVHFA